MGSSMTLQQTYVTSVQMGTTLRMANSVKSVQFNAKPAGMTRYTMN